MKNIEIANLYLLLPGCPHIIHDNEVAEKGWDIELIKKIKSRLFVKVFLLTLLLARNPTIHTQTEEAIQKTLPLSCVLSYYLDQLFQPFSIRGI